MPTDARKAAGARLCRALALVCAALLFCGQASADLWVTPAGAGTQDGSSLENACAGGTAGTSDTDCTTFTDGQTVRYCGAYTAAHTTPNAGTNASSVNTYTCDCPGGTNGSFTVASGTAGMLANKAYTRVGDSCDVTYPGSAGIQINADNVTIGRAYVHHSQDGIVFTTPQSRSNITIDGTRSAFNTRYGLIWNYSGASTNALTDVLISGATIEDNANSGIYMVCGVASAACTITRLSVTSNTVRRNGNTGVVIQDCYDGVDTIGTCSDIVTYVGADFTDVSVTSNAVTNQTAGGGIAVYGCVSSTGDFGKCNITGNYSSFNAGVIGGIDAFNSRYLTIANNFAEWNTTTTIDGNCVLVDYGNKNVKVYGNRCENNLGNSGADNSGVAIMCLKCEDVAIYSNYGRGNKAGFFFSGAAPFTESNITVYHNSFVGSVDYGVYVDNSQAASSVTLKNNTLTGPGSCIFAEASGAAQAEDYNALGCVTPRTLNSVAWTPGANDITSRILIDIVGRPLVSSAIIGAAVDVSVANDAYGDPFYSQIDIGAFRRDACYRRSPGGERNPARTRAQVASRCGGIPGRYPEGL